MKRRIYGLETEYNIALIDKDGRWSCVETELSPYLRSFSTAYGQTTSSAHVFRGNGSRIYLEGNYHPEYCTAECLDLADLIANDKAGERILRKEFDREANENGRILLFKNNVGYGEESNKSCGCHENFLIEKKLTAEVLKTNLVPFLVVRQIICGSGWVADGWYQRNKMPYLISQRTRYLQITSGEDTVNQKAILSTARLSEPHSDAEKYKRFHLILGDSNMSEVCVYLKMGIMGIFLEMLEENYPFRIIDIGNPVLAVKEVCADLTCKEPVIELSDGSCLSALDIFWQYLEMADDYERINGLSPELGDVKKKIIDVLERLERRKIDKETGFEDNSEGLDEEIDWLIKKSSLEKSLLSFGCDWKNFYEKTVSDSEEGKRNVFDQIRAKDLKYHELSDNGLYNIRQLKEISPAKLRALGIRTSRMAEEEKIVETENVSPRNTRAKIRGDFIKLILGKNIWEKFSFNWETINWAGGKVSLDDPFEAENEKIAEISSKIENNDLSFINTSVSLNPYMPYFPF